MWAWWIKPLQMNQIPTQRKEYHLIFGRTPEIFIIDKVSWSSNKFKFFVNNKDFTSIYAPLVSFCWIDIIFKEEYFLLWWPQQLFLSEKKEF